MSLLNEIRKVVPSLIAQDLVGVQPMGNNIGQIFSMKFTRSQKDILNVEKIIEGVSFNIFSALIQKCLSTKKVSLHIQVCKDDVLSHFEILCEPNHNGYYGSYILHTVDKVYTPLTGEEFNLILGFLEDHYTDTIHNITEGMVNYD